jgi:hypothetical protein
VLGAKTPAGQKNDAGFIGNAEQQFVGGKLLFYLGGKLLA